MSLVMEALLQHVPRQQIPGMAEPIEKRECSQPDRQVRSGGIHGLILCGAESNQVPDLVNRTPRDGSMTLSLLQGLHLEINIDTLNRSARSARLAKIHVC